MSIGGFCKATVISVKRCRRYRAFRINGLADPREAGGSSG
jgi:hypothetical protein